MGCVMVVRVPQAPPIFRGNAGLSAKNTALHWVFVAKSHGAGAATRSATLAFPPNDPSAGPPNWFAVRVYRMRTGYSPASGYGQPGFDPAWIVAVWPGQKLTVAGPLRPLARNVTGVAGQRTVSDV